MRLEVTRKSDLAVRSLQVLATQPERLKGPELAEMVDTTSGFVSQVLTPLVRAGWIRSDPGPGGGYTLTADLEKVSVLAVIEAIEGPTDSGQCVLIDRPCDEMENCALHVAWQRAKAELLAELESVSVASAAEVKP